jgi:hypothetical protein
VKKSFNTQELLESKSKRHETKADAPLLLKSFQRDQEHDLKHCGSVDLMSKKQNKQTTFNGLAIVLITIGQWFKHMVCCPKM